MAPDIQREPVNGGYWVQDGDLGYRLDPDGNFLPDYDKKKLQSIAKATGQSYRDLLTKLDSGEKIHFDKPTKQPPKPI